MHKLSFILLKNFSLQMLAWCSVMLATYKKHYQSFSFQKCNLSISCNVFIYDCAAYDGNY